MRLDELLATAARAGTARIVFPDGSAGVVELDGRADDVARALTQRDLPTGAKVAIWLPPSLDMVAALFGAVRAGAVPVPISDRFRPAELRHALITADVAVIITTDRDPHLDRAGTLEDALPGLAGLAAAGTVAAAPLLGEVILAEAITRGPAASRAPVAATPTSSPGAPAPAMLMFTSGTSAAAKACILEHHTLLAQAQALADDRYLLDADSVVWTPLPLFHIAGLVALLATLRAGATFVHSGIFSPHTTLELIRRERPSHALAAFETIWTRLLDSAQQEHVDLSSITVGLSANGEQQIRALHERLPEVAFLSNYGSTEGSGHVTMARPDEPESVRLSGSARPLPGAEVRIVEAETGTALAAGITGEIQFRGRYRFAGYYRDPEADAAAFTPDGWFRSGDLGRLDPDGRLTFSGRLRDMLKVGGENVSAAEVEAWLARHPDVNVCAVVGIPDDYYGEVAAAFVERAPGSTVSAAELIAFCQADIASFKVPRYVRFVQEWPMSGTKIRKPDLVRVLADELRAAGITQAPRLPVREPPARPSRPR